MIHWPSFLAGVVAAFLGSTLFVFGIMLWESRRWNIRRPFGDRR